VTPLPTRVALVATLFLTVAALASVEEARRGGALSAGDVAPPLWLLTGLFSLRVGGQVLVALRAPRWLPPMGDWNLTPYRLLLPTQLLLLGGMTWIGLSFSTGSPPVVSHHELLGSALIAAGALYAGSMAYRYTIRMRRRPGARWFGGTIPIVFHVVLAAYLTTLGAFYAGR